MNFFKILLGFVSFLNFAHSEVYILGVTEREVIEDRLEVEVKLSSTTLKRSVSKLDFYIDGSYRHTEKVAPYNFGVSLLREGVGLHTLDVTTFFSDGSLVKRKINFFVGQGDEVLATNDENTINILGIEEGEVIEDRLEIEVVPTEGKGEVSQIDFYLNNRYEHTEKAAPYNFGRNLAQRGEGRYTLSVNFKFTNGSTTTKDLDFFVRSRSTTQATSSVSSSVISINGLTEGELVGEKSILEVIHSQQGSGDISRVGFFIDESLRHTEKLAPYNYGLDPLRLQDGGHILKVSFYFSDGRVESKNINFSTGQEVIEEPDEAGEIKIIGLSQGETVRDLVQVKAGHTLSEREKTVSQVKFYINDSLRHTAHIAPYVFNHNMYQYGLGAHTFRVKFFFKDGTTQEKELHFYVGEISTGELSSSASQLDSSNRTIISFNLTSGKKVSLAIYNGVGQMVRTLLRADYFSSGKHTVVWDGLDRNGNSLPAGIYSYKILALDTLRSEYVTSLGTSPKSKSFDSWVGNIGGGAATIALTRDGVYMGAGASETAPLLVKDSLDNQRRIWTGSEKLASVPFNGAISLGVSEYNNRVYILNEDGIITVAKAENGKRVEGADINVLPTGHSYIENQFIHTKNKISDLDMSVKNKTLAISHTRTHSLRWYDIASDVRKIKTQNISNIKAVYLTGDNEAYVIADGQVKIYSKSGYMKTVISRGLSNPKRLAVAPTGDIFVVDGFPTGNIKRFSASGSLLTVYGKSSGRSVLGAYHPQDFRGVTDIEHDGKGGFYVAEPHTLPVRTARFSKNGDLLHEWLGGQPYYTFSEFEPNNNDIVWFNSFTGMVRAKIDFEQGTYKVLETWDYTKLAKGIFRELIPHLEKFKILRKNGLNYFISERFPQVLVHTNGSLRPVMCSDYDFEMGENFPHKWELVRKLSGYQGDFRAFMWTDKDADGVPEPGEFEFNSDTQSKTFFKTLSDDFSGVQLQSSRDYVSFTESQPVWRGDVLKYPLLAGAGLNEVKARTLVGTKPNYHGAGAYKDSEGSYYGHFTELSGEAHGDGGSQNFGTDQWGGKTRLVKWSADGKELWSVGRGAVKGGLSLKEHLYQGTTPNAQMHMPINIIGESDKVIVLQDQLESPGLVWTKDGLYVGDILDSRANDGLPDTVYSWWRDARGEEAILSTDSSATGDLKFLDASTMLYSTQGRNSSVVYKVTGWDNWLRDQGSFNFNGSKARASRKGAGAKVEFFADTELKIPSFNSSYDRVWAGMRDTNHKYFDKVIDGRYGAKYDWSSKIGKKFSLRIKGRVEAPLDEEFIFSIYRRGKVRLWIDGKLVVNAWSDHFHRSVTDPIKLVAKTKYSYVLEYAYDGVGAAGLSLMWESSSLERERIPKHALFTELVSLPSRTIPASSKIMASSYVEGQVPGKEKVTHGEIYGFTNYGSNNKDFKVRYSNIDFGSGKTSLTAFMGAKRRAGDDDIFTYEWRLDSPNGKLLGRFTIDGEPKEHRSNFTSVTGVHDVYLVNISGEAYAEYTKIKWFTFD